jgi:CubicO group peptidase (beta-lactamase class C family)
VIDDDEPADGTSALAGIADWAETWQVPNAAAAVLTKDGVVDTFGDLDRSFRLASVTKLLSAYAVLVAVEEEAFGLDDPAGPPDATVRHLLAHTAGYGFESDAPVVVRPRSGSTPTTDSRPSLST